MGADEEGVRADVGGDDAGDLGAFAVLSGSVLDVDLGALLEMVAV